MNSGNPEQPGGSPDDSRDKWITIDRLCDAYEASLQEGDVERAPFLAGVPRNWRQQLTQELDAIDAAYRDAEETREQTMKTPADEVGSRRLPTKGRLAELATLDSDKVWLGRFEIRKRLGTGATGSVWCARDARLARWVALKVPHASRVMSETSAARFQTEARAAAAISHPNVVQVHEVLIEDGLPILIQQWIDGPSLAKYMKDHGPLEFDQAADWMAQIADAVACAHEKGIVHRDLKPANVMLNKNRPMVLDFGLASYPQFSSGLTTEGTVLGTPAYMSPEQAEGAENANQPATDIYALGTILYEMLVGTPPFVGKAREVLQANKTAIPTPPRSRRGAIPRDLETITLRCLAKSPSARYRSAADLQDDLQRYRRREPIRARKVSVAENIWAMCRLHPAYALVAVGAPLVVLLLMGMVISQLRHNRLSDRARRLVRQNEANETEREQLLAQRHMVQLARASQELSEGDRTRGLQLLRSIPEPMRDWEWRLLDLISHSPSKTLNANVFGVESEAMVSSLAVARKRRQMFSASKDGLILRWKLPSDIHFFHKDKTKRVGLEPPEVFYQAPVSVNALEVSPDEKWLSWVDRDGAVTVWDLQENERHQRITHPKFRLGHALTFSPDSKRLVVGGGSAGTFERPADEKSWLLGLRLGDSGHFTKIGALGWTERSAITSLQFINDEQLVSTRGRLQASLGTTGYVERWRCTETTLRFESLIWRGLSMRGLDFHAGSNRVAWCDDGGMAYVHEVELIDQQQSSTPPRQFRVSRSGASQVRFSPNGSELVVTSSDGGVSRWFIGAARTTGSVVSNADTVAADTVAADTVAADTVAADTVAADTVAAADVTGSPSAPGLAVTKIPAEKQAAAAATTAKKPPAGAAESAKLPAISHIRDYRGHENTVWDAVYIAPMQVANGKSKQRNPWLRLQAPYLITCGEDGLVLQWSNAGHAAIETLNVRDRSPVDATWISPQQIALSTTSARRQQPIQNRFYSLPRHQIDVDLRQVRWSKSITKMPRGRGAVSLDSRPPRFAVCCRDRILVFETGNPTPVATCLLPEGKRRSFTAACLIDSRLLIAAASREVRVTRSAKESESQNRRQASLLLFDLQDDATLLTREVPGIEVISRLKLSPNGTQLFGSSNHGIMLRLQLPSTRNGSAAEWTDTPIQTWTAHRRAVKDFVWIADQGRVATVSDDGTCAIWSPADQILQTFATDAESDSVTLNDQTVALPEVPRISLPELGHRLLVSSNPVTRVAASSLGDRIATVGDDRVIRIWDSFSGLELISLERRKEKVVALEFSPDDRYLMIAEAKGRVDVIELIDSSLK